MGSWNMTCGISNLPIMGGDEVCLFLLEPSYYQGIIIGGSGYCESSQHFRPATLPVYGEYEDYGGLYSYGSPFLGEIINHIKYNFEIGKYKSSKEGFDYNNFDIKLFIELVEEGYIYMGTEKRPLGYVMIHKDVLSELLGDLETDDDWRYKNVVESYSALIAGLNYRMGRMEREMQSGPLLISMHESLLMYERFVSSESLTWFFANCLIEDGDVREDIKKEIFSVAYTEILMNRLRKSWMPQSANGSGEQINSSYEVLSKVILKKKGEKEKEY